MVVDIGYGYCASGQAGEDDEQYLGDDMMWIQGLDTILYVTENPTVSGNEELALEELGYRVLTASTELEGIQLYNDHWNEISLVLLDVNMPVETCWELKRLDRSVRIMAVVDQAMGRDAIKDLLDERVSMLPRNYSEGQELAQVVHHAIERQQVDRRKTA